MTKSDSIVNIAKALVAAQKNLGVALKDAKNPFFKSKFADLSSVIDAALPALNAEGISVLQPTTTVDGKAVVQTILLHSSGEFISSNTDIVCAKQNDPQAYGSAISYGRRYGLQSFVTLKAEDNDAEGAMNREVKLPTVVKSATVASTEASNAPPQTITLSTPTSTDEVVVQSGFKRTKAVKAKQIDTMTSSQTESGDLF
jgi:hypothetical protein